MRAICLHLRREAESQKAYEDLKAAKEEWSQSGGEPGKATLQPRESLEKEICMEAEAVDLR